MKSKEKEQIEEGKVGIRAENGPGKRRRDEDDERMNRGKRRRKTRIRKRRNTI